jgi:hypothetical protein
LDGLKLVSLLCDQRRETKAVPAALIQRKRNLLHAAYERLRTMSTILLIIVILLLLGALPTWPYSTGWGYYPSGGLGLVLLIVIILLVSGRI